MRLAEIKPGESLIDLGSGDGRILFAASKHGAHCLGIEINPLLVWYTRLRAWLRGSSAVSVRRTNLWSVDISAADVVTIYMVPIYMQKLKEKVQAEMKPGSRILAAVHPFPDWAPGHAPQPLLGPPCLDGDRVSQARYGIARMD